MSQGHAEPRRPALLVFECPVVQVAVDVVHALDSGFQPGFQDRAVPREADLEIEDEERVPAEVLLVVGAGEAVVVRHDWFVEPEVDREPEKGGDCFLGCLYKM